MSTFLGIDIGTTSCKICLIDENQRIIDEHSKSHNATVETENPLFSEQCPQKIVEVLVELLKKFDLTNLKSICCSGQMHGIILWNKNVDFKNEWSCSNLITWLDQRCDSQFLDSLPVWKDSNGKQEAKMSTGYGLSSLAWLHKNDRISNEWNACGSIMDFFNFLLTKKCGIISDQIAYSFGYATNNNTWQENVKSIMPENLLPKIVNSTHIIGDLDTNLEFSHPKNVKVYVALGDLQTSMYKVLKDQQAVLHIGTSSQLTFSMTNKPQADEKLLRVPYFQDKYLIVAASLNGGNVLELLVKKITQFYSELYEIKSVNEIPNNKIKDLLDKALSCECSLKVDSLFFGERHNPNIGASLLNFYPQTSLPELFGSAAIGIIRNLSEMLPSDFMQKWGVNQICLLNRATHPIFERAAQRHFNGMNIITDESSFLSAAFGAACFCCDQK